MSDGITPRGFRSEKSSASTPEPFGSVERQRGRLLRVVDELAAVRPEERRHPDQRGLDPEPVDRGLFAPPESGSPAAIGFPLSSRVSR